MVHKKINLNRSEIKGEEERVLYTKPGQEYLLEMLYTIN